MSIPLSNVARDESFPIVPLQRRVRLVPPPVPLTSLVGREDEIAAVGALLRRDDVRLVLLTGPGGIGKTRVALAVAAALLEEFDDGVAWAPVATIRDPAAVAPAMARALGISDAASHTPLDAVRATVRDARILLLVDNFEQVTDAAPELAALLTVAPGIKVLVTSRSRLRVSGEHTRVVPPLRIPDDAAAHGGGTAESEATRLFVDRASAAASSFTVTPATAPFVVDICRRLDGVPLAIELAAARTNHLTLPALHARLERRLPLLTGGAQDLPARHQTLRDTIAWSYDLLDPEEQMLFRRLAVFAGGFTLEAAETVGTAGEGTAGNGGERPPPPPSLTHSGRSSTAVWSGATKPTPSGMACWKRSGNTGSSSLGRVVRSPRRETATVPSSRGSWTASLRRVAGRVRRGGWRCSSPNYPT